MPLHPNLTSGYGLSIQTHSHSMLNFIRKIEIKGENIERKFIPAVKIMLKTITNTFEITIHVH